MKHPKSTLVKSLVVLIATALFGTAMVSRGVTANEAAKSAVGVQPASPAKVTASLANHSVFVKRLKESAPEGNALLMLQFDDNQNIGKQLKININNTAMVFHDDGTSGDEVAGSQPSSPWTSRHSQRTRAEYRLSTRSRRRDFRSPSLTGAC